MKIASGVNRVQWLVNLDWVTFYETVPERTKLVDKGIVPRLHNCPSIGNKRQGYNMLPVSKCLPWPLAWKAIFFFTFCQKGVSLRCVMISDGVNEGISCARRSVLVGFFDISPLDVTFLIYYSLDYLLRPGSVSFGL